MTYNPVLHMGSGTWMVGRIQDHTAKPLSRDEVERMCASLNEAMREIMICEAHPWLEWPHDDCDGPGCPPSAAIVLMRRRERRLQIGLQAREATIVSLYGRVLEVEGEPTRRDRMVRARDR